VAYVSIAVAFGIATGLVAKARGSSFFLWLLIGAVLPAFGLIAAFLYKTEEDEPERRCPRCGAVHKLYVQVCNVCGEDLYLPTGPGEVRYPRSARQ
jgi:hypothetical protein